MEACGIVKKVDGKKVAISILKNSACGSCDKCSADSKKAGEQSFITDLSLKEGDHVSFQIEDKSILKLGVFIYLFPAFAIFLGYFVASTLSLTEPVRILSSFVSFFLYYVFIFIFDKIWGKSFLKKISIKKAE